LYGKSKYFNSESFVLVLSLAVAGIKQKTFLTLPESYHKAVLARPEVKLTQP
jgi:hypothetical protein